MNINFELYRIFYVVANNKNITKSSRELMISQPAVSKAILNLESQLGGTLFVRTKRGVILTEEGKEFYKYIKEAMDYIYNAENRFKDLISLDIGIIRIGISATLTKEFLIPYLKEFHEKYPKILVEINTEIASELLIKLRNGLLDIVIYNIGNKVYSDLNTIICNTVNDCFVVNKDYNELLNRKVSLNELNNYPLILQMKYANTRILLDEFLKEKDIYLRPSMELASYNLVVEFAKIGFGIGYVTKEYIKKELDNKELFILDIEEKIPTKKIGIAISKNHIPSFSANKLIEIITKKR